MDKMILQRAKKRLFDGICGLTGTYKWLFPEYSGSGWYGDITITFAAHDTKDFCAFMMDLCSIINKFY